MSPETGLKQRALSLSAGPKKPLFPRRAATRADRDDDAAADGADQPAGRRRRGEPRPVRLLLRAAHPGGRVRQKGTCVVTGARNALGLLLPRALEEEREERSLINGLGACEGFLLQLKEIRFPLPLYD